MSHYDLIALGIREARSREAAEHAHDMPARLAHLELAARYKDEVTAINRHAIGPLERRDSLRRRCSLDGLSSAEADI